MSVVMLHQHEFQFTSSDGLGIACARWDPAQPIRGAVQIAHGMGEHLGRYIELIQDLVNAGMVVYGNDHRGHGRTALSRAQLGDFGPGGFDLLVEDIARLTRMISEEHPYAPIILLGHSMGSFAAQQLILTRSHSIDGLALSGSGALEGLVRLAQSSQGAPADIMNAGFQPARTPCDWLSRDSATVDAFIKDPLCFGWLHPDATKSFFASAAHLSDPASLSRIRPDLPVYIFSGSEDPVGRRLKGVHLLIKRYRRAGLRGISHDFYPGGRHEMLNEINRSEVRSNLVHWIAEVLAAKIHANDISRPTPHNASFTNPKVTKPEQSSKELTKSHDGLDQCLA
jgi:alpha-beta hydrolase superfamily lysophospholipase